MLLPIEPPAGRYPFSIGSRVAFITVTHKLLFGTMLRFVTTGEETDGHPHVEIRWDGHPSHCIRPSAARVALAERVTPELPVCSICGDRHGHHENLVRRGLLCQPSNRGVEDGV